MMPSTGGPFLSTGRVVLALRLQARNLLIEFGRRKLGERFFGTPLDLLEAADVADRFQQGPGGGCSGGSGRCLVGCNGG
jgi:hypothetical protein